jgi:hypothetical protein
MPESAARRRLREEREKATAGRETAEATVRELADKAIACDVEGYPIQAMTGMRLGEIDTMDGEHEAIGELVTEVRRLLVIEAAFNETMNPTVPYNLGHRASWDCAHGVRIVPISTLAVKIAEKRDALAKLRGACREVDRLRDVEKRLRARLAELGDGGDGA